MSLKKDTDEARKLYLLLRMLCESRETVDFLIGETIHKIKEDNLYKKATGDGIDTWHQFLKQPEIDMSQYEADKLETIYKVFKDRIDPEEDMEVYKIDNLWYIIRSGLINDIDDEIMEMAASLSNFEFKEAMKDKLNQTNTYSYMVMQRCETTNNLKKVKNISSEEILDNFNIDESIPKRIQD